MSELSGLVQRCSAAVVTTSCGARRPLLDEISLPVIQLPPHSGMP